MQTLSLIPSRSAVIRAHKERGRQVAAVTPIHNPRALLRAFGILPVEVWGPPRADTSHGTAHLQPYVCSIVRNVLAFLQTGGLDVADLILVPHACDSLQGLGSLLIDLLPPRQPVIPVYLPRGRRASDVEFLTREFGSLYRRLEAITQRSPSHDDLMASIRREENADRLLAQLCRQREQLDLTDMQFYRLIRSREYVPAESFARLALTELAPASPADKSGLESALSPRQARREGEPRRGIPIILSGIVPEPMSLFQAFAEMGAAVVADDLACCGRRLYPPGTSDDPFQHLAESILGAPPDSTRGHSIQERLDHLIRLARTSGARGIIFYGVKFCEPELFDLPILRKELQESGIPSATVEVDISDPLSNQTLTRLEAFVEMMSRGMMA